MIDRRLQALRAVNRYGTVTRAAEAVHLTPSAVSQQIRQLSDELGVPLLERRGRGVRLTDAAQTLITHADALHARWEQAQADLAARGDGRSGTLRICGFPTAVAALVAPAAGRLRSSCPNLSVRVSEVETKESFGLLLTGEVDIGVVLPTPDSAPIGDAGFQQEPLLDEPQDLLVSAGHELATRDSVTLSEAAREPWIVAAPGSCDAHELLLVACAAAGFTPSIAHHAAEWPAVSALVAQGLGVALIPRLAQIPPGASAVRIPIGGSPVPSRRILTCVRRGSRDHPVIEAGLEALHDARDGDAAIPVPG